MEKSGKRGKGGKREERKRKGGREGGREGRGRKKMQDTVMILNTAVLLRSEGATEMDEIQLFESEGSIRLNLTRKSTRRIEDQR